MLANRSALSTGYGFQNSDACQHQVIQSMDDLFSAATEDVYVVKKKPEHQLERARINYPKEMKIEAEANSSLMQHSFYIISQKTTWSCLNVSPESFHNIVKAHSFSDNIYDVVRAFGHRRSDIQQFRWSACRVRLGNIGDDHYEICYRIQYPVRNNRNRGDPFSMRQIGICQKACGPQNSTWMILQPSSEVLSRLELMIDTSESFSVQKGDPMSLHLIFLEYQSIHWDDYVENLRESLEPLIEAAHFSRVGRSCKYPSSDYSVEFEQCQDLQRFQWKLAQIVPAIDGNIAVLKTCEDCWREDRDQMEVQAFITDVRGFIKMLEFQKENIRKLGDQAQRSAELLHRILDFRTSRQMEGTNTAMSQALVLLSEQAKILTLLGEQRDKDSKAMKALTSVATLYLPATLVATVFSSNLVQVLPIGNPSHFVAAPQPWLPVVAVLSLMTVTLISIWLLERVYRYMK